MTEKATPTIVISTANNIVTRPRTKPAVALLSKITKTHMIFYIFNYILIIQIKQSPKIIRKYHPK